jgi:hypothetical protein
VRWLTDAALLLRAPGFDWDRLVTMAGRRRCGLAVAGALAVLDALTAQDVPRDVLRALERRPMVVQRLATHGPRRRAPLRPRETLAGEYLAWLGRHGRQRPLAFLRQTLGLRRAAPRPGALPVALGVRHGLYGVREPFTAGWWSTEPHGTWSRDRVAVLDLPLAEPADGPLELTVELACSLSPLLPRRRVLVLAGWRPVARWSLEGTEPFRRHVRRARLPVKPGARRVRVRFVSGMPASPLALGTLTDPRPLGISLQVVTLSGESARHAA